MWHVQGRERKNTQALRGETRKRTHARRRDVKIILK
jgi:hypothetical protein